MNTDFNTALRPAATETHRNDLLLPKAGAASSQRAGQRRTGIDLATHPGPWAISDDTRSALEICELFQDLGQPHLMEVAALVEQGSLRADEMLLWEGHAARYVFVIIEGTAVAHISPASANRARGLPYLSYPVATPPLGSVM